MSYDDWKCSPPCPTCGTPNCICTEPEHDDTCDACNGSGKLFDELVLEVRACDACDGRGTK